MATLRRDASINAGSNIALAVLGIVSGSLVSYRFGPVGRGSLGAAQVVGALCAGFGAMGLGDAMLYWIASKRSVGTRLVLQASLIAAFVAGLLGTAVGVVVTTRTDIRTSSGDFVLFCGLVAGATAFYTVPTGALRGAGKYATWNGLRVGATSMWIVALLIVTSIGHTLHLAIVGIVYAVSLTAIGSYAIVRTSREIRLARLPERERHQLRPLILFGLPSAFASAPLLLNARIDQVAVAINSSANNVGQYVAAAGYCWATVPFGQAIANLTATRVAAHADHNTRATTLRSLSGLGVTVVGASGFLAWIAAPIAIRLLNGPGFGGAVGIARILLVGATLQGVTFLLEEGARGLGRPKLAMVAELSGLVTMVALLAVFSRRGVTATAVASTMGYVMSFVVIVFAVGRVTSSQPWELLRPTGIRQLQAVRNKGTE